MRTRFIKRMTRRQRGAMSAMCIVVLVLVLVPLLVVGFYEGRKAYWDAQVRERCAKDGGIKVYETVSLSAEKFGKFGAVQIPLKKDVKPGDAYYYEWQVDRYGSEQAMRRDRFLVVRRSDSKLLGEAISYGRRGGDMPGPWHPSSFRCPEQADDVNLMQRVFVQAN